jgi:hypothetical protein
LNSEKPHERELLSFQLLGDDNSPQRIDLMVYYKLYDITYDEIKIIAPEIEKKITREEWGRVEVEKKYYKG